MEFGVGIAVNLVMQLLMTTAELGERNADAVPSCESPPASPGRAGRGGAGGAHRVQGRGEERRRDLNRTAPVSRLAWARFRPAQFPLPLALA